MTVGDNLANLNSKHTVHRLSLFRFFALFGAWIALQCSAVQYTHRHTTHQRSIGPVTMWTKLPAAVLRRATRRSYSIAGTRTIKLHRLGTSLSSSSSSSSWVLGNTTTSRNNNNNNNNNNIHQSGSRWFSSSSSPPQEEFALSHPSEVDDGKVERGRIVAITSGKGGVGKTTSAASFAMGLAQRGRKTCVVDFDIGLRNLDIHLGCERRVIFDFVNVLMDECTLNQALLKDKREPNLSMLAASQTRDKESLTVDGVERVLAQLAKQFDYVVLDSPAGIESGARHAMYFADDAIIVTNPELSACRDADKMVGFIWSKSRRAELGPSETEAVSQTLLITRYSPERAEAEESLSIGDIEELLGLPVVGVVPESKDVLTCTNMGSPVISLGDDNPAAGAYSDMVDRFLGEEKELRFVTPEPVSFFSKLFN